MDDLSLLHLTVMITHSFWELYSLGFCDIWFSSPLTSSSVWVTAPASVIIWNIAVFQESFLCPLLFSLTTVCLDLLIPSWFVSAVALQPLSLTRTTMSFKLIFQLVCSTYTSNSTCQKWKSLFFYWKKIKKKKSPNSLFSAHGKNLCIVDISLLPSISTQSPDLFYSASLEFVFNLPLS